MNNLLLFFLIYVALVVGTALLFVLLNTIRHHQDTRPKRGPKRY